MFDCLVKGRFFSLVYCMLAASDSQHVTLMSVVPFKSLTLTRQTFAMNHLSCLFTLSALAVNTDSHRSNLCHLVSLCGVTSGWGNRGTACGRQEGGDEVGGGQSEAPKGSERGL